MLSALLLSVACEDDGPLWASDMGLPDISRPDIQIPDFAYADGSSPGPGRPSPMENVLALSSTAMTGRKSGTPGGTMAAAYIADQLAKCGVKPFGEEKGSYYQTFKVTPIVHTGPMVMSAKPKAGGATLTFPYRSEWRCGRTSPGGDISGDLLFVGYGSDHKDFDEYKGMTAKDTIVMAIRGCAPGRTEGCGDFDKLDAARRHQAKGLILLADDPGQVDIWGGSQGHSLLAIPVAVMKREPAAKLLGNGRTVGGLQQQINSAKKPVSYDTKMVLSLKMSRKAIKEAGAYNVLGIVRAADASVDEYVLAGAHYDHLGYDEPPAAYFPGALDNASGTAVVIEAACLAAKESSAPKRHLVFALWAAEEDGLIGSHYFTGSGLVKLTKIDTVFNLDMVGGTGNGDTAVDISTSHLTAVSKLLSPLAKTVGTAVKFGPINTGNSDHAAFVVHNIRTIYLRGPYPPYMQYHTRQDVPSQLSPSKLTELGKLVQGWMAVTAKIKNSN